MCKAIRTVALLLIAASALAHAQSNHAGLDDEADSIDVNRDRVRWPSPETVASDLRSAKEETRIQAFQSMGFSDHEMRRAVWSQGNDAHVVGTKIVMPDQIQLTYAALGESNTQQAILAVFIEELQATQLAVVTPVAGGWERIALIGCWCKYEMLSGIDALASFSGLVPAPSSPPDYLQQPFELVVRVSGGGSGFYQQSEVHFRVTHDELRAVLSFTSRRRECNGHTRGEKVACSLERRWFYPVQLVDGPGGVLVQAKHKIPDRNHSAAWWAVRDLEIQELRSPQCASYLWDAKVFRYRHVKMAENPCTKFSP